MTDASAPDAAPPAEAPVYRQLLAGDRFPGVLQACGAAPRFAFDGLAGRYQLFGFFLSADDPQIRQAFEAAAAHRDLFDGEHAALYGVTVVPRDREVHGLANAEPGLRFVWDFDMALSEACGAMPLNRGSSTASAVARKWVLVDPSMHVLRVWPMRETPVEEILAAIEALPPPDAFGGVSRPAPILMLPNVLEPELCQRLIALHQAAGGGVEIGVVRGDRQVLDPDFKRRRDITVTDPELIQVLTERIARRVRPEIERLFFLRATYVERHIVGCYDAADGGHFSPHIDNGAPLTAHRRFAVSINLSGGFEGGETVFPEYNSRGYKAPPGWAVIFPCAILHAVRKVTSGVRYAYLPFIYDDTGLQIRNAARTPD